jgi:LETM1 and EF-hand domain-containing protein 1
VTELTVKELSKDTSPTQRLPSSPLHPSTLSNIRFLTSHLSPSGFPLLVQGALPAMSLNRTASQMGPLLLRSSTRATLSRSLRLPRQLPAVAILIPHRALSGDQSTSSSNNQTSYPPPGFNVDQAKKPSTSQEAKASLPDTSVPVNKASEHAPTKASEQHALEELASDKIAADKAEQRKLDKKKEENKKLTLRQKIMKEVHHYWDGTKLLAAEVKISSKLALKMAAGYELTRREHRQVSRSNTGIVMHLTFA